MRAPCQGARLDQGVTVKTTLAVAVPGRETGTTARSREKLDGSAGGAPGAPGGGGGSCAAPGGGGGGSVPGGGGGAPGAGGGGAPGAGGAPASTAAQNATTCSIPGGPAICSTIGDGPPLTNNACAGVNGLGAPGAGYKVRVWPSVLNSSTVRLHGASGVTAIVTFSPIR